VSHSFEPDSQAFVVPNVKWGRPDELFTPSYWKHQAEAATPEEHSTAFRLGATLEEEVVACLLGGYGIPAEVGIAAFNRLRDRGVFRGRPPSSSEIQHLLGEPLMVGSTSVRYRFARQKSEYVAAALMQFRNEWPSDSAHRPFREWLLRLKGVGLKTASWITRNWLASDEVAIIDVHIYRAGLLSGLFLSHEAPVTSYRSMEERFLRFASAIGVRTSVLDSVIWRQMRIARRLVVRLLGTISGQ